LEITHVSCDFGFDLCAVFAFTANQTERAGCTPGQGGTSEAQKNRTVRTCGFSTRGSSLRRRAARYTEKPVKRNALPS
jgi:hypothetical protein